MECEYGCNEEAKYKLKNGKWCCSKHPVGCKNIKQKLSENLKNSYKSNKRKPPMLGIEPWNKGMTKDNNEKIKKSSEYLSSRYLNGELEKPYGKCLNEEEEKIRREKISKSMIKAHSEGRANNWQDSIKYNRMSYPEYFFSLVIQNEFNNKDYVYQKRFHQFSLDFVWEKQKKVIEIDGEQHERLTRQKENDILKDKLLKEEGWEILRIKWKDFFNDTKYWINKSKEFIECSCSQVERWSVCKTETTGFDSQHELK